MLFNRYQFDKKKFEAINYIYLSSDELKNGVFSKLYSGSENHDLFGNKNIFIVSLQDQKASKEIVETLKNQGNLICLLNRQMHSIEKNFCFKSFF